MPENKYEILNTDKVLHDISSIIELVDSIIIHGCHRNSSDIHIDPIQTGVIVRLRIDGVLTFIDTLPLDSHEEIIARIKVLSGLRTDIHFVPQDGRFRFKNEMYDCDIRVSTIPTHYGENAVMRILKNENDIPTLGRLGFSDHDVDRIVACTSHAQGMILVTGPTGSGKTSTLYTIVSALSNDRNSIITLEDPIEYAIKGVRQIQIHTRHGITFANGLRSIVRQDPDIIMVGEIRDAETAQISTNVSLTGHLLLSTLHTNSALGAIPRLIDMGIDPYLVSSTLTLIIAQRLVRKLCISCHGQQCIVCGNLGYKGRTVVSETLVIDDEIRKYIMSRNTISEISRYSRSKGMVTMYEDGMEKVEKGITSIDEINRILHD
ncbi:MAG: GspE/PulE family protein [Patescibacteria group bacterium]